MYQRLLKLIEETVPEVDVSKATLTSRLKEDLGFDSIALMMLSMAIEDEFKVIFDEPVLFETVQDVLDFLSRKAKK